MKTESAFEVKRRRDAAHRKVSCYVVEEVTGERLYTAWDKEEAMQKANRLLLVGQETRNSIGVRHVRCSYLPPPVTERGELISPAFEDHVSKGWAECPVNLIPSMGFCIEKFQMPGDADLGSVSRTRRKGHFLVWMASKGSWDQAHQRYLEKPRLLEIWHPVREQACTISSGEIFFRRIHSVERIHSDSGQTR